MAKKKLSNPAANTKPQNRFREMSLTHWDLSQAVDFSLRLPRHFDPTSELYLEPPSGENSPEVTKVSRRKAAFSKQYFPILYDFAYEELKGCQDEIETTESGLFIKPWRYAKWLMSVVQSKSERRVVEWIPASPEPEGWFRDTGDHVMTEGERKGGDDLEDQVPIHLETLRDLSVLTLRTPPDYDRFVSGGPWDLDTTTEILLGWHLESPTQGSQQTEAGAGYSIGWPSEREIVERQYRDFSEPLSDYLRMEIERDNLKTVPVANVTKLDPIEVIRWASSRGVALPGELRNIARMYSSVETHNNNEFYTQADCVRNVRDRLLQTVVRDADPEKLFNNLTQQISVHWRSDRWFGPVKRIPKLQALNFIEEMVKKETKRIQSKLPKELPEESALNEHDSDFLK